MSQKFTEGFEIQAVEKALSRSPEITLVEMAETLNVSRSAQQRWITQSRNHQLDCNSANEHSSLSTMTTKEKCPQDWTLEERSIVHGLSDQACVGLKACFHVTLLNGNKILLQQACPQNRKNSHRSKLSERKLYYRIKILIAKTKH